MAGPKQHFIPRSFLRGFLTNIPKEQVWQYRSGKQEPILNTIMDVACQRHFYSRPQAGETTLDDQITEHEKGGFENSLARLRSLPVGSSANPDDVADVLAHLTIRNSQSRDTISEAADTISSMAKRYLVEGQPLPSDLFRPENPAPKIAEPMLSAFQESPAAKLTPLKLETIMRAVYFRIRECVPVLGTLMGEQIAAQVMPYLEMLEKIGPDAHVRALAGTLAPERRAQQLASRYWSVEKADEQHGVILPDCIAIARTESGEWESLFLSDHSQTEAIVFPLTSATLLFGSLEGKVCDTIENVNEALASHSSTFFVAHQQSEPLTKLIPQIGTAFREGLVTTIGSAMHAAGREFFRGAEVDSEIAGHCRTTPEISPNWEFSVSMPPGSDIDWTKEVGEAIGVVAGHFSEGQLLKRFERIEFFATKEEVANRFVSPCLAPMLPRGTYADIAMENGIVLSTRSDDDGGYQVFAPVSLAEELTSQNEQRRAAAVGNLWGLFGRVDLIEALDDAVRGIFENGADAFYERSLHSFSSMALADYAEFRQRASQDEVRLDEYELTLTATLDRLAALMPALKIVVTHSNDWDWFFVQILRAAQFVLLMAARYLGALAGRGQQKQFGKVLVAKLDDLNLKYWFVVFESDLDYVLADIGAWRNRDQLLLLNRHVERVLLHFGIISENRDDGGVAFFLDVPLIPQPS